MAQHTSGGDFVATARNGLLTIEKIGHEPWFVVTQGIKQVFPPGTELQFDATLQFDTVVPKDQHGFGYVSGLYMVGRYKRRLKFDSIAEHEPNLGAHAEQHVVTRVITDVEIDHLEAGFTHQAGGTFTIREPRLVNINSHPECRLP
jgi:hypothetical protein